MAGKPVITIDGPAGAGKSTVAREVAKRLGLRFLDTGSMYRAFTWKALQKKIDFKDVQALVRMIRESRFEFREGVVILDGRDISAEIRTEEVTKNSKYLADPPPVRAELVRLQQEIGRAGGLVTEGRDQGTVVFPRAEFKFYLDASIEVRADRRHLEVGGDPAVLKNEIAARDERDRKRPVGALKVPGGAIILDTSGLDIDEVVRTVMLMIRGS